jgi:GT2 family glycosyltransferase
VSVKFSIIIPTAFDGLESRLKPCIDSVLKFTDTVETEIIVVKNGCSWESELDRVTQLDIPEATGYPSAVNAGIKISQGEFVVLLNDDTILLEQSKNQWIEMLHAPFADPQMAITGPWMNWCPYAEHDFLIFFCVMIRKSVFDTIGLLDAESFGVGYGEDCDLCCKAKAAGFKISQVPIPNKLYYDGRMAIGALPIYHAGNQTFANWPGGEELLRKNRAILHERYGTNIGKAHELDGWISDAELRWLALRARKSKVFVQLGAWHGKSSRAIADNLPPEGKLYDIDTWNGSKAELETNHWSARLLDGDHAFDEYARGMWDHLASGKVTPLKMLGKNGAALLRDMGIKADTVFIDGGHGPGETKDDIEWFLPLRKEGGIIAGHDYMHEDGMWSDVGPEVKGVFGGNIGQPPDTHIWYTDSKPMDRPPAIFDCFPFNNEFTILEWRLRELYDVVDRFVIVEATTTHSGKPKELNFEAFKFTFSQWLNKITYIVVSDMPEVEGTITDKSWARERHQRDAVMRGLTQCRDNDVIIISDCDEIPSPDAIRAFNGTNDIRSFEMDLFYYNHETKAKEKWREAKIAPYKKVKELTPCGIRYAKAEPIPNGGQHLSYFGGVEKIIKKIEDTAHCEYDTPEFKNPEHIQTAIATKSDLFERPNVEFELA